MVDRLEMEHPMTPAETLDKHAHEAHRLALDWPAWRDRPIPDGQPRAARTDGMPRGGDVSDPTGNTVVAREGMTMREGLNLDRQVDTIAGHLLELTLAMATETIGHAPATRPELSTGIRLAMSAVALTTVSQNARQFIGCDYDGEAQTPAEAFMLVGVYLARLRAIIPATKVDAAWAKEELCHGGPREATWHKPHPEDKPAPAVTRDGLCDSCRKRRDRHEDREVAA
jgi:hypothetical protein